MGRDGAGWTISSFYQFIKSTANLQAVSTIINMLSAVIMALATCFLWRIGNTQSEILQETDRHNVLQERAFVFRQGYHITNQNGKIRIVPMIKNSGSVPVSFHLYTDAKLSPHGKNLLIAKDGERAKCSESKFGLILEDIWGSISYKIRAPHEESEDEGGFILERTIEQIRRDRGYYVWGIIAYLDGFDDVNRRQTRFCDGIVFDLNDMDQGRVGHHTVVTCTENCMDDQCNRKDPGYVRYVEQCVKNVPTQIPSEQ
jgi:hypothetical protein